MRILVTADPELPVPPVTYGGIERIVDMLVRELMKLGHEVTLVANQDSTCPANNVYGWPSSSSSGCLDTLRNGRILMEAVRRTHPHLIHSFSRLAYLLPQLRGSRPVLMSYQRHPTPRTIKLASALAARSVLTFSGASEHLASLGRRCGGEWHAIPNFVDTEFYTPRVTISPDAPLVFLSRVESIKGADVAIKIARQSGVRLIIAGNHAVSGPEADYWQNQILPELGKGGVDYLGAVNDIQKNELLGRARALLVPILWDEPFGIVFAEALACGTPVISCPRGALPEIVRHGVEGFLIRTVEDGCSAVARLGEIDRARCRDRVETTFSSGIIARRYADLYERLVRRCRTSV